MSKELIAKLEAAEAPSRELDAEIQMHVAPILRECTRTIAGGWGHPEYGKIAPPQWFTSSLDAGRALLLPGWEYLIFSPEKRVEIWAKLGADDAYDTIAIATAQTVENAFCIAALRARGEG